MLIIPTLIYLALSIQLGFLGPRINLDFLAIYIVTVVSARLGFEIPRPVIVILVALVLTVQILLGVGAIYVDDPALIAEYFEFIAFWPWRLISFWAVIGIAGLTALHFVLPRLNVAKAMLAPVVALLVVIVGVDIASRSAAGFGLLGSNVATSSAVRAYKMAMSWRNNPGFAGKPITTPTMASEIRAMPVPPERLMSVSVEALGLAKDPAFNAAMFQPMRDELKDGFDVSISARAFRGATLAGEIRELCAMQIAGTPRREATARFSPSCLPNILKARGYRTMAIHGNPGFFYNRHIIYPQIGFSSALFYDDLRKAPVPPNNCRTRAFEGICDRDAWRKVLAFVAEKPMSYGHIMTLDTHFPLGPTPLGDDSCGRVPGLKNPDLCLYANQMANLLRNLAIDIKASPNPPDEVVIFGDHAPPYAVASDRLFFDREHVPLIVIRKRAAAHAG